MRRRRRRELVVDKVYEGIVGKEEKDKDERDGEKEEGIWKKEEEKRKKSG